MIYRNTLCILAVYSITLLLTKGSIFDPFRFWIKRKTPFWYVSPFIPLFKNYEYPDDAHHFCECRMCMGLWVCIFVCIYYQNLSDYWIVYGASYFLATQER